MKRIAIIDDDKYQRVVIRSFLEENGYYITAEGSSGEDALDICREHLPDVLLLDLMMPGIGGIEAARRIHDATPTAIVLLTAKSVKEVVEEAAAIGVMAFIEKPFREDELIAAIELAHARFAEMADLAKENERLKGAMDSRKLIERAKGMLMDTKGMKEKEAYILLRKMSMDKRLTMESVAERMLTDVKGEA